MPLQPRPRQALPTGPAVVADGHRQGSPRARAGELPGEKLLSRAEAARHLGVPVSTIYGWAKSGRLPYRVTLGGHLRFAREDLDTAATTRPSHRPATPRDNPND